LLLLALLPLLLLLLLPTVIPAKKSSSDCGGAFVVGIIIIDDEEEEEEEGKSAGVAAVGCLEAPSKPDDAVAVLLNMEKSLALRDKGLEGTAGAAAGAEGL
jgi:hypothetical protein